MKFHSQYSVFDAHFGLLSRTNFKTLNGNEIPHLTLPGIPSLEIQGLLSVLASSCSPASAVCTRLSPGKASTTMKAPSPAISAPTSRMEPTVLRFTPCDWLLLTCDYSGQEATRGDFHYPN